MGLNEDVCKVVGHDWDGWTGSGEARRTRCNRCKIYIDEWVAKALGAKY